MAEINERTRRADRAAAGPQPSKSLRFEVLGPLRVVRADTSCVAVGARQHQIVLANLLAARGRVVSDAVLAVAVWGVEVGSSNQGALRVIVHHLRRALGSEVIRRAAGGYQAMVPAHGTDIHDFTTLVDAAGNAETAEDACRAYRRALALWRGTTAFEGVDGGDVVRVSLDVSRGWEAME